VIFFPLYWYNINLPYNETLYPDSITRDKTNNKSNEKSK
jgi:hypothetical protein